MGVGENNVDPDQMASLHPSLDKAQLGRAYTVFKIGYKSLEKLFTQGAYQVENRLYSTP